MQLDSLTGEIRIEQTEDGALFRLILDTEDGQMKTLIYRHELQTLASLLLQLAAGDCEKARLVLEP